MDALRWGIMGTGGIAAEMASTLRGHGSPVVAVGSARPGASAAFAAEWDIPDAVGSHTDVAEHPDVDIVYVATTNDRHHANVLDAVAAGKHALCEKPIALNVRQASELLDAATLAGVLVMEGMWMRFLPFLATVDGLLEAGAVGPVTSVSASFGFSAPVDQSRRWMNRDLGGGALLDLGIYPLTLAHHVLGEPTEFAAMAQVGPTGVDLDTRVISHHGEAASASITASFIADTTNEAVIAGSDGRLRLHAPFHHSPMVTLERGGEIGETYNTSFSGHGFRFEVTEMERCVAAGLVESPMRPHEDTLAVMRWMDAIRARVGVVFDQDDE